MWGPCTGQLLSQPSSSSSWYLTIDKGLERLLLAVMMMMMVSKTWIWTYGHNMWKMGE